ncbi:MAG TPA: T9SS type A sorting domain-containing protein [Chitinophagaceae bacterium]|nr:T9SS type A sorting domain-containing protein [Chitinophagaceae bacterium]
MGLVVSGGTTSRVTVTVGGNVTMTNGLANTKPTINIASGTLNIAGNITIGTNPTFSVSNGTVNYNGSSSQSISTQAVTYNNLILSGGGAKTLANNATATVTGTATFTNGILNTTSANLLTINNTATVTGASDNSFVQGPVKKVGNTAFTFPVGNVANGYHPLSISAAGTGFGTQNNAYTAEYVRANAHSVGNTIDNSLSAVSGCEYWNYTRNNGTSNPNVTLSWNAKSSCGGKYITTTFSLAIGYYNSGQSKWVQASGSTITYNSANPYTTGTITRNSLSSFGAITFASLNTGNASPLPVKFGDVKAYSVGTAVKVDWQAYNEVNVDHYEVERSTDGVHFSSIGSVAANNRTELSNYTLTDAAPVSGSSFYRIKNVDIDGKFSYSVIVKVSSSSEARMSLYPNPVKGTTVALQITGLQKGMYNLRVFNTTGQQVYGQQISHPGGNVTQSLQLPATLKPGVYNVQLSGTDVRWNRSLVVE